MFKKNYVVPFTLLMLAIVVIWYVLFQRQSTTTLWIPNSLVVREHIQDEPADKFFYYTLALEKQKEVLQSGYSFAAIDNYRDTVIDYKRNTLEYLINGKPLTTSDTANDITGYPSKIFSNENYMISVEILDVSITDLESDDFDGARSRVVNLETLDSIIVKGLLFNDCLLAGNFIYCTTFDFTNNEENYLEVINVKTMQSYRKKVKEKIQFIYESHGDVYLQTQDTKQAFIITGGKFVENASKYNPDLEIQQTGVSIVKDIQSSVTGMHQYVLNASRDAGFAEYIPYLFTTFDDDDKQILIPLQAGDNLIQVIDATAIGRERIFMLVNASVDDAIRTLIYEFNQTGEKVNTVDITDVLTDTGRPMAIDYMD